MNQNLQPAKFSLVLKSQLFIVMLGLLFWLAESALYESNIGYLPAVVVGVVMAIVTFLFFWLLFKLRVRLTQSLMKDIQRIAPLFSGYRWWHCACVAALAGIGEELLFRGVVQVWFGQHFSIAVAIGLSSLIFGLLHYLSFAYFICATLMSIVLGVGYYLSGSLLAVMLWHGVYDFIALMVIVKYPHILDLYSVIATEENT